MKIEKSGSNATPLPEFVNGGALDPSNPNSSFFIGVNENSGALLVTQMLDCNNYHSWASLMKRALRIKNKLGFIDGTIREPTNSNSHLMEH